MNTTYSQAKGALDALKVAFDAEPCNLDSCEKQLAQLKLAVFTGLPSAAMLSLSTGPDAAKEQLLVRETLELACFLSIRRGDLQGFERHIAQLKMYYNNEQLGISVHQLPILGLYLCHLLASDRVGEFHTELELISVDDYQRAEINLPILLERYLMEGNYAKALQQSKELPQKYGSFFSQRLYDMVRQKVGASLERSYHQIPVAEAVKMLILDGVPQLQEFALRENERKARQEDDTMGDMTPSLTRRVPVGLVQWEVKDGQLLFKRSGEKRAEIPAFELMENTIGYATDLERIV